MKYVDIHVSPSGISGFLILSTDVCLIINLNCWLASDSTAKRILLSYNGKPCEKKVDPKIGMNSAKSKVLSPTSEIL